MKTLIELTFQDYNRILEECPELDREYAILKNGLLTPYVESRDDTRTVIILCNADEAKAIIDLAKRLFPNATPKIGTYAAME